MKIKKSLVILLCLLNSSGVFSESKIVKPKELKVIEERVAKELASNKNDPSKKFLLNMLAARETYQFRFYDKAFINYGRPLL